MSGGRHSIELECTTGARLSAMRRLYSSFANLAINAVRYTPAGGHIRISWRQGAVVEYTVEGTTARHRGQSTSRA